MGIIYIIERVFTFFFINYILFIKLKLISLLNVLVMNCIMNVERLGFPFKCADPFLFAVYHQDFYPKSTEKLRRGSGSDFDPSNPYRMYHGIDIPGFPQHPHRGFETVTATMMGTIDHTDSLGSAGRYGGGDLQWMTAGSGVVHGEMFPLVNEHEPNTCRFFQIWLNLPKKSKMVDPTYVMHWSEEIPKYVTKDGLTTLTVWAGEEQGLHGLPPPPNSYASDSSSEVAIWLLTIKPGGSYTIPPAAGGRDINRMVYFVEGAAIEIGNKSLTSHSAVTVDAAQEAFIRNADTSSTAEVLMLQGRPIGEPVAQYGPFVMNTEQEIKQAYADYQRTQFGGWPWPEDAMTFPREKGRFTLQKGVEEFPPSSCMTDQHKESKQQSS